MLVSGAGLTGIFNSLGVSGPMVLVIILALAAAGGVWALFRWFLKWREKGKSLPFMSKLMRAAGGTPQGVAADPAKRARLDDLRKKFEEGVEKFRSAGKNVYGLPWYLLVGPSGAGKTEALRHCNVGFPPGLQDYLQGAGGTLNMHWWFTNHAVILDTAGKMFMEEVGAGESSEWKEFLKLLKDSRTLQPINGMLLCIGVDSLIKDSADEIQEKAGKIARQLDLIQRTLDVRFPVYVLVTKCDLITGFREFFEKVTDPQLQHQMLGWSNPAGLDEAFQPDKVGQHIESVRERLIRRRFAHLVDPVHTDDPQARRTDQVDSLFALPDSLARLSSRLRRYLELIFVAGEWSPKPLFLRGIYFTSSMRQGAELDEEVAKILGMPVDALPGGGMTEEKSYFLRDVFTSKVFKERGLVTRATNVTKQQRARKLALVGTGIAAVLALGAFTVTSYLNFRESIDKSKDAWASVARGHDALAFITTDRTGRPAFNADKPVTIGGEDMGAAEVVVQTRELAERPPSVPWVLKPLSWVRNVAGDSINEQVRQAHEALLFDAVVRQTVDAARERFKNPQTTNPWESLDPFAERASTGVLAGLLAIERDKAPPPPRADAKGTSANPPLKVAYPIDMDKFCAFLLPAEWRAENDKKGGPVHAAAKEVQDVLLRTYEGGGGEGAWAAWPPKGDRLNLASDPKAVDAGVKWFIEYWSGDGPVVRNLGTLGVLRVQLEKFSAAEEALATLARAYEQKNPDDYESFAKFRKDWEEKYSELEAAWKALEEPVKSVKNVKDLDALIEAKKQEIKLDAEDSFRAVMGEAPADPMAAALEGAGDRLAASKGADAAKLAGAVKGMMAEWPDKVEPLRKQLLAARDQVIAKDKIGERLTALRAFFSTGDGGKLLARSGGDAGKPACQLRFEAYQLASQALALGEDSLKGDAAPKLGKLADAGEKLEADIKSREDEVSGLSASLTESPRLKIDKTTGFGAVFKAARRHARYRVIESGLAGQAPVGTDAWPRERVAALAATLAADPISKKIRDAAGVPMLSPTATAIDAEFNPDAARIFFRDVKYMLGHNPRTGSAPNVLQGPGLSTTTLAYDSANAYANRYLTYWSRDLLDKRATIEGSKKWSGYQAAMGDLSSREDAAAAKLRMLGEGAGEALRIDGLAEALGESAGKDAGDREKWAAELARSEPAAGDNLKKYLAPWRALPDDAIKAMTELGGTPKDEFESRNLQGFACSSAQTPRSAFSHYVDALRLRALETIAGEVEGGRTANAPKPQAPLRLDPDPSGRWEDSLPLESVRKVRDYWFAGTGAPGGAGGGAATVARGGKTRFECVNTQLSRMFDPPKDARLDAALLKALDKWIPFLIGDGTEAAQLQFRVQVLPADAVSKTYIPIAVRGSESAHYIANCTETALGAKTEKANENGDDNKTLCDWTPMTLDGNSRLKFTFRDDCNAPKMVYGTRDLKSGWAVLEILAEPESRALDPSAGEDGPSKAWAVPVKFKGSDGKNYHKWVRIEFNALVPSKRSWPDARAWGDR